LVKRLLAICVLLCAVTTQAAVTVTASPNPVALDQPFSIKWQSSSASCTSGLWGNVAGSGEQGGQFAPWAGGLTYSLKCGAEEGSVLLKVCPPGDAACLGAVVVEPPAPVPPASSVKVDVTLGKRVLRSGSKTIAGGESLADVAACAKLAGDLGKAATYTCPGTDTIKVTVTTQTPPPSVCGALPATETRSQSCPSGSTGSFAQTRNYSAAAYPTCSVAGAWLPASAPSGACSPIVVEVPPTPPSGSPLGVNDVVKRPTAAAWSRTVTPSNTGDAYSQSPLFLDQNGNKIWFTPAAFALGNGGMQSMTTWANSTDDFGSFGTYRTGPVYAYPSAVWGWRAGEGCVYGPCANKRVADFRKFEILWNWKGPAGPNGGADKVDVLIDAYLGSTANPSGDFANKDKAQNLMLVSTIDGGDSGNAESNFSYFGTLYLRGRDITTPAGKKFHVWQCPTSECQWSTVPTVYVWLGPAIGSNAHTAGSKNSRIDYLDLIHGLESAGLVAKNLYIWGVQAGWEIESGGAFSGQFCLSIDDQAACR
jgi:hypothetical protein